MTDRHRGLFTTSAAAYDQGRPGYPERVYELLHEACGLGDGTRVLEVGPGTGQATGELLARGAHVTAVELGAELAELLRTNHRNERLEVIVGAFEDVEVREAAFDLVASATAFHWVPAGDGLAKAARCLVAGGHAALWWNVFGDATRDDPFSAALEPMLARLAPELLDVPSAANTAVPPYALDVAARVADFERAEAFGPVRHELIRWTGRHDPVHLRSMFASFSPWIALEQPRRDRVLDEVQRLAAEEFGGVVERPYTTPVYIAERR